MHSALRDSTASSFQVAPRTTWEIVRRVARYLRPYRWMALGTISCALLSLGFAFTYPRLTRLIIDDVIGGRRTDLLVPVIAGLFAAFLLRDVCNSLRIRLNNTFEQNVIFDLRREVYSRLQRLPAGWFDQRSSGDLMTRVIEDVNTVERLLIDGTEQGAVAVLSIGVVATLLFFNQPLLAGIAMIPLPFLAAGALWYTLTAHQRYRRQRQASSAMNALLMDNLQGVRQIKSFGRETHEDARFTDRAGELRAGSLTVMRAWAVYHPAMNFIGALGTVLVLWVGGRQVLEGRLTVGALIEFVIYLALFYEPVRQLHSLNQMLQSARAAGERVFDILDATEESTAPAATQDTPATPGFPGGRARGEVCYDDVSFAYSTDRPAVQAISLHARPGDLVALVGPTGAGKSTIVNLLPAFYRHTTGRITIDGQDIAGLPLDLLRAQVAVVSQEPFLFNGTLRENILYGRLDASTADLEAAARAANCHEFITRLPEGYDTKVGERGVKLSVGEKQRVSIARALLKNAPILVLDEATASVDTATEKLIQEALERLMRGRTSFVIAHRLSTIRGASQILVVKGGTIVERGTHEQLLAGNGLYFRLARIQNTTFIEEGFARLGATDPG